MNELVFPKQAVNSPAAIDEQAARRGGRMGDVASLATLLGTCILSPVTRRITPSDRRAFNKRVSKRRAKKGYR